jgi:GT2 family glycosyltransferase
MGGRVNHGLILATRNRPDEVIRLLSELSVQTLQPSQVIVVDASDSPLSRHQFPPLQGLNVQLLHTAPGLTLQRNAGLIELDQSIDIVHFLDDDVEITPDYFQQLENAYLGLPDAHGIGVRTSDNRNYRPSGLKCFFLLDSRRSGKLLRSGINVGFRDSGPEYLVDWLPGCAMSYRINAMEGLRFDTSRTGTGWGEDVDFSARVGARGPLYITSQTHVIHKQSTINRDSEAVRRQHEIRSRFLLVEALPRRVTRIGIYWSILGFALIPRVMAFLQAGHSVLGALRHLLMVFLHAGRSVLGALMHLLKTLVHLGVCLIGVLVSPLLLLRNLPRGAKAAASAGVSQEEQLSELQAENESQAIFVELQGGLGNQLFGLAVGIEQSSRLEVPLRLKLNSFSHDTLRTFELEPMLNEIISLDLGEICPHTFREKSFAYDPRVDQISGGTVLEGYFQSWKYFTRQADRVRDLILDAMSNAQRDTSAGRSNQFIALQVRRGDYLESSTAAYHGVCGLRYFEQGLRILRQQVGPLPAVVFSDDVQLAHDFSQTLDNCTADIPNKGESALETLGRLSRASGFVISNSSFGWWGAWLAGDTAPTIAPRPWFAKAEIDVRDLLPLNWSTIDHRDEHILVQTKL